MKADTPAGAAFVAIVTVIAIGALAGFTWAICELHQYLHPITP